MKGLQKGRIVLYQDQQKKESAAIVTDVHTDEGLVNLMVFKSGMPAEVHTSVPYSKETEPSTWRWPDRK